MYAETNSKKDYQEKKIGFFAVDFTYDLCLYSKFTEPHGHFKYGKKIFTCHTMELGAKTPVLAPILIAKYSYDFYKIDKWILGVSASLLLGLKFFELGISGRYYIH